MTKEPKAAKKADEVVKPVSSMTPEEKAAKKELNKLRKTAIKLGIVFTDETTAEQLSALIEAGMTAAPVQEDLPDDAHTYYVWKDGVFDKFFTNEQYKGDAKRLALEYAAQIGGTVTVK